MKKLFVPLILALLFAVLPANTFAQDASCKGVFSDTKDHPLCKYTEYIYHQNVASGSNGLFMPESEINRGQAAKMIVNAFGLEAKGGSTFSDVPEGQTFYSEITTLSGHGIVQGKDGRFMPDEPITRGQFAGMIARAVEEVDPDLLNLDGYEAFPDLPTTHTFFYNVIDVYLLTRDLPADDRIISGYQDGTFRPDAKIKRAEAAKILTNTMRYLDLANVDCSMEYCEDQFKGLVYENEYFRLVADRLDVDASNYEYYAYMFPQFNEVEYHISSINYGKHTLDYKIVLSVVDFDLVETEGWFNMDILDEFGKIYDNINRLNENKVIKNEKEMGYFILETEGIANNKMFVECMLFSNKIYCQFISNDMGEDIYENSIRISQKIKYVDKEINYEDFFNKLGTRPNDTKGVTGNALRRFDVGTILNAGYQYSLDHNGLIPYSITMTRTEICKTGASDCAGLIDLSVLTVDRTYLDAVPVDPLNTSINGTGYYIVQDANGRITVDAPLAENGEEIRAVK